MDDREKREIASKKDIPLSTRASVLYEDSTKTRALVLAVPYIGSSIDLLFSKKANEYTVTRIHTFLEELKAQLDSVEKNSISVTDEEALFDLMQTAYDNVARTRSKKKIHRFACLIRNHLQHNTEWDESETALRLISDLTDTHIQILIYAVKSPKSTLDGFKGLNVFSVSNKNMELNLLSLQHYLNHLSDATLTMYCSELVSRGLLHDEGVNRFDGEAIEILTPTESAKWLLGKIDSLHD